MYKLTLAMLFVALSAGTVLCDRYYHTGRMRAEDFEAAPVLFFDAGSGTELERIYPARWDYATASTAIWTAVRCSALCLPAFVVCLVLFTRRRFPKGIDWSSRCRRCGYVLKGLSEPTCSECGEHV